MEASLGLTTLFITANNNNNNLLTKEIRSAGTSKEWLKINLFILYYITKMEGLCVLKFVLAEIGLLELI